MGRRSSGREGEKKEVKEGEEAEKRGHLFPASTKRNELVAGDERMRIDRDRKNNQRKKPQGG